MADECIFCKLASGEIPCEAVYEDEDVFAFRDLHPGAPSHVLVIPRRHIPRITDTDDAELLGKLLIGANKVAEKEGLIEKGFRYAVNFGEHGGQLVMHVHIHVLGGRPLAWPPG